MEQKFIDLAVEIQRNDIFLTRYQIRDFYKMAREKVAEKFETTDTEYIEKVADYTFMESMKRYQKMMDNMLLYGNPEGAINPEPMGILHQSGRGWEEKVLSMPSPHTVLGFSEGYSSLVK